MITINNSSNGSEIDIRNGSHMFCRDKEGKEIFKEWSELDQESRKQLSELAELVVVHAEGIMGRAKGIIR
jgi:hypothetical protein